MPGNATDSKRTVFKTVAAFANGTGGSIVFGVEGDEATVSGLGDIDLVAERDRLTQLVRTIVTPSPEVEVRSYDLAGKVVLVFMVQPGSSPPYGIRLSQSKADYYVRQDATTFPALPDEIRSSVLASAPAPVQTSPWGY